MRALRHLRQLVGIEAALRGVRDEPLEIELADIWGLQPVRVIEPDFAVSSADDVAAALKAAPEDGDAILVLNPDVRLAPGSVPSPGR